MPGKGFPQTPLPQNVLLTRKLNYTILKARPQSQLREESLALGGRGMGHDNRKLWISDLEAGYFRLRPNIAKPGEPAYDRTGLDPSDLVEAGDAGKGGGEGNIDQPQGRGSPRLRGNDEELDEELDEEDEGIEEEEEEEYSNEDEEEDGDEVASGSESVPSKNANRGEA